MERLVEALSVVDLRQDIQGAGLLDEPHRDIGEGLRHGLRVIRPQPLRPNILIPTDRRMAQQPKHTIPRIRSGERPRLVQQPQPRLPAIKPTLLKHERGIIDAPEPPKDRLGPREVLVVRLDPRRHQRDARPVDAVAPAQDVDVRVAGDLLDDPHALEPTLRVEPGERLPAAGVVGGEEADGNVVDEGFEGLSGLEGAGSHVLRCTDDGCDAVDHFEGLGCRLLVVAEPDDDFGCATVDLAHEAELPGLLLVVLLVDADGVRPYVSWSIPASDSAQGIVQVLRDLQSVAIAFDRCPARVLAPDVGDGGVRARGGGQSIRDEATL